MIYQIAVVCAVISMALADGYIGHAKPYAFGYSVKDHHGEQHREETGDAGHAVKGSYGFTDARGVKRQVDYVADHAGFRAEVKTNEPGTASSHPAAVKVVSSAHPYFGNHAVHGGFYGGHGAGHGAGYGGHGGYGGGLGFSGHAGAGYGAGYGLGHGAGYGAGYGGGYGAGYGAGYGGHGHGGYGGYGGYGY